MIPIILTLIGNLSRWLSHYLDTFRALGIRPAMGAGKSDNTRPGGDLIFVVVLAAWCFDISIGGILRIAFPTLAFAGMLAGGLGLARRFPYAAFAVVALLILGVWGVKQSVEQTSTFADKIRGATP